VLSTFIQSWKSVYFKSQQAFSVSIFVIVFFLLINSNILWLFGYETTTANGTTVLFCFEVDGYEATRWMTYWGTAHLFLYSVLPFLILAILNIILVSRIYRRKRAASSSQSMRNRYLSSARARRSRRSSDIDGDISNAYRSAVESLGTRNHHHSHQPSLIEKMSKAVVFITVSFIVLTLPIASASSFFAELAKTDAGLFVIVLLDSLSFSYHAFNIFISYTFNTVHREAVNTFFCGDIMRRRKRRRYANSSANQNSYPLHVVRV
jgi:ABC-type multidrug transport system fused ATPase/permease subunit